MYLVKYPTVSTFKQILFMNHFYKDHKVPIYFCDHSLLFYIWIPVLCYQYKTIQAKGCSLKRILFEMVLGLWCLVPLTFNNISIILWQSVLLVEEPGVPRETHRPASSH